MPATPDPARYAAHDLLAGNPARSARLICLALVAKAAEAAEHLGAGGAAAVTARHDLRVALRALRTNLRAYAPTLQESGPAALARKVRSLARRIGGPRDDDVQRLLWESVRAARTRLQQDALATLTPPERHATESDAEGAAIRDQWHRLEARLRSKLEGWHQAHRMHDDGATGRFAHVAADALERAADTLDARFAAITDADAAAALHSARLATKKVRYLLKPLTGADDAESAAHLAALSDAQDLLGSINDAHLLRDTIRAMHVPATATARVTRAALSAADRDLTRRIAQAFARLASWRDAEPRAARTAALHAIAARWRAGTALPMEYERKWLLSALPPHVHGRTAAVLRQGYLPGETLVERIRSVTTEGRTEWIRTVKLGRGMARIEVEERTTAAIGKALYALTKGRRVRKRRYAVADGHLTWEIDDFSDRTLVLAEVEFADADGDVELPAWLAPWIIREVTDDAAFTNWKLAR